METPSTQSPVTNAALPTDVMEAEKAAPQEGSAAAAEPEVPPTGAPSLESSSLLASSSASPPPIDFEAESASTSALSATVAPPARNGESESLLITEPTPPAGASSGPTVVRVPLMPLNEVIEQIKSTHPQDNPATATEWILEDL